MNNTNLRKVKSYLQAAADQVSTCRVPEEALEQAEIGLDAGIRTIIDHVDQMIAATEEATP